MSTIANDIASALEDAQKPGGLIRVYPSPNVEKIRKRLKFSQKKFSEVYLINLQTLRSWEQKKRSPDSASKAFLRCIEKDPEKIRQLLHS